MGKTDKLGVALLIAVWTFLAMFAGACLEHNTLKYDIAEPVKEKIQTMEGPGWVTKDDWITKYVYNTEIWEKIGNVGDLIVLKKRTK